MAHEMEALSLGATCIVSEGQWQPRRLAFRTAGATLPAKAIAIAECHLASLWTMSVDRSQHEGLLPGFEPRLQRGIRVACPYNRESAHRLYTVFFSASWHLSRLLLTPFS